VAQAVAFAEVIDGDEGSATQGGRWKLGDGKSDKEKGEGRKEKYQ
jgi:hypothetical protein